MSLPGNLVESVRSGSALLCLGAGASIGAQRADGSSPPDGRMLRDRLCDRFLDGRHKDESLGWVAELALAQADQFTVQDFVASHFTDLTPAAFHYLLPTFKWRGVISTNYDRVVEEAYLGGSPIGCKTSCPYSATRIGLIARCATRTR